MSKNSKSNPTIITRRNFLGQASCAAVGTTALFSSVLDLGMFNALACTGGADYRALVCVFLGGGNDSYNMLLPRGISEHQQYAQVRGDLAIPRDEILPINPVTQDGREYGIHPGMGEIQNLFENGQAAFMANVGTLVEPTTRDAMNNGSVQLPLGLFSHSDQSMHWQSSVPEERSAVGWAGRMADLLSGCNSNPNVSMNISLSGNNIFQTGNQTSHYTIGQNGTAGLRNYNDGGTTNTVRTQATDGILGMTYQHLFERTFASTMRGAIDVGIEFNAALNGVEPLTTVFSDNRLSQRLSTVARAIAARETLGMRRQTFFIEIGGWDHHDNTIAEQAQMLPQVSMALSEFQNAMVELGIEDSVTTYTASDFARTLTSNGRGSDHAWGGNQLIVGGAVQGGDIYGQYPELYTDNPLDTGRGRLIPTTSIDEYFAELALWYGVPQADLPLVFPNLSRFYSTNSNLAPVGFVAGGSGEPSNPTPVDFRESDRGSRGENAKKRTGR